MAIVGGLNIQDLPGCANDRDCILRCPSLFTRTSILLKDILIKLYVVHVDKILICF